MAGNPCLSPFGKSHFFPVFILSHTHTLLSCFYPLSLPLLGNPRLSLQPGDWQTLLLPFFQGSFCSLHHEGLSTASPVAALFCPFPSHSTLAECRAPGASPLSRLLRPAHSSFTDYVLRALHLCPPLFSKNCHLVLQTRTWAH